MRLTPALALGLALTGPAAAQTAPSEAGAKAIGAELAVYFGTTAFERKVVTVVPDGKGYRLTFAPNAAIAPFLGSGGKVDIAPYSLLATERGDGDWDVASSDPMAISFDMTIEGQRQTGAYKFDAGSFSGIYSPKLGSFRSGTIAIPGGTIEASDPASDVSATFGPLRYETEARESGPGAIDATMRQTVAKIDETVSIKLDAQAGTPATDVRVAMGELAQSSDMSGLKSRAILDLWAFAVARADRDATAIVKDQEVLRGLLGAALPVWTHVTGTASVANFDVTSAFGRFSAADVKGRIAMDGVSTETSVSYGFDVAGLSVDAPMMPGWAAGVMPRDLSLTFKVAGLDIETPAKRVIAEFDLSKDPALSEETTEAIAAAFAAHPPRLLIEGGRLSSRDLDLTLKGEVRFASAQPEAEMTIEAKGLDTVIAGLQAQAATDPSVNETVGMLALSQGFAKRLPDGRSQWIISTKADGSVILNGNPIVPPTPEVEEDSPALPAPTDENALPTQDPATTTP